MKGKDIEARMRQHYKLKRQFGGVISRIMLLTSFNHAITASLEEQVNELSELSELHYMDSGSAKSFMCIFCV